MKLDFLFISNAPAGRIEHNVITAFFEIARSAEPKLKVDRIEGKSGYLGRYTLAAIGRSRTVVVHSPLFRTLPAVMLSRLVGADVWALVWDRYPVKVSGRRYDNRLTRKVADVLEQIALKLCTNVFVPSGDFLAEPTFFRASVLRMWPRLVSARRSACRRQSSGPLKVIFAGQVNETRGLQEALKLLASKVEGDFRLLIASASTLPSEVYNHPQVVALGHCSAEQLASHYKECDFGLVSLSEGFEGPAFPSKTLEYVAHGLPVIYFGPALTSYVSMLQNSGVGIHLKTVDCVSRDLASGLRKGFDVKRTEFMDFACLDAEEISALLNEPR